MTVKGAVHLEHDFDLAPGGKGLYTTGWTANGPRGIYIDPKGSVHVLGLSLHGEDASFRVSPDGHHLAYDTYVFAGNVWLIENF